jgi:hypothetical protein
MTGKLENAMLRELSANELDVVSGAKPMEAEAGRYTTGDWGWINWQVDNAAGCWLAFIGDVGIGGCSNGMSITMERNGSA